MAQKFSLEKFYAKNSGCEADGEEKGEVGRKKRNKG